MTSFLENKTDFINSNKASYLVSHHEIMEKLIKKGLNDNEIDYCCLYASGMNSQNVADSLCVNKIRLQNEFFNKGKTKDKQ